MKIEFGILVMKRLKGRKLMLVDYKKKVLGIDFL